MNIGLTIARIFLDHNMLVEHQGSLTFKLDASSSKEVDVDIWNLVKIWLLLWYMILFCWVGVGDLWFSNSDGKINFVD